MANQQTPPHLESFTEITSKLAEILDWTADNADDHVYHFICPENLISGFGDTSNLRSVNACVAGSAALDKIYDALFSTSIKKWKANDVDIFFLSQESHARMSIGLTDIVKCKETSVEELLLNFDMAICRVAYNFSYDIWISVQCIATLYTKRQNVPKYLKVKQTFMKMLKEHKSNDSDYDQKKFREINVYYEFLYNRFAERIKKYQSRGFGVNWIETEKVSPWIINRFHYIEWNMTE